MCRRARDGGNCRGEHLQEESDKMKRFIVATLWLFVAVGCGESAPSVGSSAASSSPSASASPSPSASPTLPDPCQLVTQNDAVTLAGSPLEPGVEGNANNLSCTYTAKPTDPTAQVEVHIGDGAKKTYDIDVQLGHVFTDISGLGDEAHEEIYAIFVRVGQLWMSISVIDHKTEAENRAGLETLARKVAPLI
jgi:hypothetical protein